MRAVLFLILACASIARGESPAYRIEHLTTGQGLSHNTVGSVLQDSRGFIWIGTIDGLNRFDGYSFFVFRHDPADSTSLSSSFIHGMIEDVDGRLWVGTRNGGVSRFDPAAGTFRTYLNNPTDPNLLTGRTVGPLLLDGRNRLWVGTENGLGYYDRERDRFVRTRLRGNHASDDLSLAALAEADDSTFLLMTEKALYTFHPASGTLTSFSPPLPASNFYNGILIDRQRSVWVGSNSSGVFKLQPRTNTWQQYPARPETDKGVSSVYAVPRYLDSDGRIWFTTQNGLDVFDPATGRFSHTRHIDGNPSTLSSSNVSAVMRDAHGDLWVGTWGGGVDKIVTSRMKFPLLTAPRVLANNFVLAALEDARGDLWVGTGSGVTRIVREGKRIVSSTPVKELSGTVVWCLMEDSSGVLWIGTDRKGIAVLDSSRRLRTFMQHDPRDVRSLPENTVRTLFRDSRGRIWAGLQTQGVAWYDPGERAWNLLPAGTRNGNSISDVLVWAVNEDGAGNLWFGTYVGGLNRLDPTTGRVTYFRHREGDTSSLPVNDVRGITLTRAGELWIATYGGGICRYNPATDSFTRFAERDGLANNFAYGILEDTGGELWIPTNRGLARFSPGRQTFRTYTSRDGLQSDEFNTGAYARSERGELFIGGIGGLNYFFPEEIKEGRSAPPVVLTSLKVFDRELLGGRVPGMNETITLQHAENFFSFEFAALDFVDASRNVYMYKLEGFDNDWVRSGTRRYASYTNLDPGNYTLHIRAANSDGIWNEDGVRMHLTIVPPFWQRWWFRGTAGLVLVAAFAAVVRYASTRKLRKQLQELEKERALQNERERISRDLHDNAGAQLASIIAGLEVAEKYIEGSGRKTKDLIDSLRADARSSMMRLRETIWALQTNAMTAEEFTDAIRASAERQLKYVPDIELNVVNKAAGGFTLSPNQVLNLFRIVQESITNAIKHADARRIDVVVEVHGRQLCLSVKDDGRGSDGMPDQFGGKGMLNMQARARELGGEFRFHSGQGGSRVEVKIPCVLERVRTT